MHLDYDLNDNLFIADKEVKRVVDSSDEDIDLRTVELTNYLKQHN